MDLEIKITKKDIMITKLMNGMKTKRGNLKLKEILMMLYLSATLKKWIYIKEESNGTKK